MDTDDFKKKINNKLYFAVATGEHNDIPELIRQGADINAQDEDGKTPLMVAARWKRLDSDILRKFVELGADVNARDKNGWTALMWTAVINGVFPQEQFSLFKAFLSYGADIKISDIREKTCTAMSIMVLKKNIKCGLKTLKILFSQGYSIRDMYPDWTPENFLDELKTIRWLGADPKAAYVLYAAASIYPEKSDVLNDIIKKRRSAAFYHTCDSIFGVSREFSENVLSVLLEGKTMELSLGNGEIRRLIPVLLECIESNPELVADFVKKRVRTNLELWVNEGFDGAEELVAKLVPHMKNKHSKKNKRREDLPDIINF